MKYTISVADSTLSRKLFLFLYFDSKKEFCIPFIEIMALFVRNRLSKTVGFSSSQDNAKQMKYMLSVVDSALSAK